jgi:hypothetical protein
MRQAAAASRLFRLAVFGMIAAIAILTGLPARADARRSDVKVLHTYAVSSALQVAHTIAVSATNLLPLLPAGYQLVPASAVGLGNSAQGVVMVANVQGSRLSIDGRPSHNDDFLAVDVGILVVEPAEAGSPTRTRRVRSTFTHWPSTRMIPAMRRVCAPRGCRSNSSRESPSIASSTTQPDLVRSRWTCRLAMRHFTRRTPGSAINPCLASSVLCSGTGTARAYRCSTPVRHPSRGRRRASCTCAPAAGGDGSFSEAGSGLVRLIPRLALSA